MATIDELVAVLQTYTQASTTLPTADAVECVNTARREMQRRHDWRAMQRTIDLDVPTSGRVVLPDAFLHEFAVYPRDVNGNPGAPLQKIQRPEAVRALVSDLDPTHRNVAAPGASRTGSAGYYLWAGTLVVVPAPSQVLSLMMDYAVALPDLVASQTPAQQDDLTVRYVDVVRAGALAEAYTEFLHEEERGKLRWALFEARLERAMNIDKATGLSGMPSKRGA